MVKSQIAPNMVDNPLILEAMADIPREEFILPHYKDVAYIDSKLPVGEGRFILPPTTFARMIHALNLDKSNKVLDIACGTGYSSAILSRLCKSVLGIDNITSLLTKAHKYINAHNEKKITFKNAELLTGDPNTAPFNAILVNGSFDLEPKTLLSQLTEGGRLVMLRKGKTLDVATLYTKSGNQFKSVELFNAEGQLL